MAATFRRDSDGPTASVSHCPYLCDAEGLGSEMAERRRVRPVGTQGDHPVHPLKDCLRCPGVHCLACQSPRRFAGLRWRGHQVLGMAGFCSWEEIGFIRRCSRKNLDRQITRKPKLLTNYGMHAFQVRCNYYEDTFSSGLDNLEAFKNSLFCLFFILDHLWFFFFFSGSKKEHSGPYNLWIVLDSICTKWSKLLKIISITW